MSIKRKPLPFLGKSYQELGLLGRISYIASAVTAVCVSIITVWQMVMWLFNDDMDPRERVRIEQHIVLLNIESALTKKQSREREIAEEIIRLQVLLKEDSK